METYLNGIVANYLLMPVMAVLTGIIAVLIAKKNHFLTKRMIVYFLLGCIILVLPSISGWLTYRFMPYAYLLLQQFYFIAGVLNLRFMAALTEDSAKMHYAFEFFFILVMTVVSMAFFSLFFNLCNELRYGLWASTCLIPFLFATVFRKAYCSFMSIPVEVYKLWHYSSVPAAVEEEEPDSLSMFVVDVELTRNPGEADSFKLMAKVSGHAHFGRWFQSLLDEYNQKTLSNPIHCYDSQTPYGWVFYIKHSYFRARRYINPDETFGRNNLKAGYTIVARRVLDTDKEPKKQKK